MASCHLFLVVASCMLIDTDADGDTRSKQPARSTAYIAENSVEE